MAQNWSLPAGVLPAIALLGAVETAAVVLEAVRTASGPALESLATTVHLVFIPLYGWRLLFARLCASASEPTCPAQQHKNDKYAPVSWTVAAYVQRNIKEVYWFAHRTPRPLDRATAVTPEKRQGTPSMITYRDHNSRKILFFI